MRRVSHENMDMRNCSSVFAELQMSGHAVADAGDADILTCRAHDHVKLQVCSCRPAWIVGTSKIANSNLCDPDGLQRFFVKKPRARRGVRFFIAPEISRREISGVSKKTQ